MPGIVTFQLSQNVYAQTPAQTPPEPGPPADCKEMVSLWSHTYGHPGGQPKPITWSRFVEHKPTSAPDDCVVAKGVIENTPSVATDEHDGDYHFLLTPDTGYKNLLNHFNTKGLMVEIICWDKSDIAPYLFFGIWRLLQRCR